MSVKKIALFIDADNISAKYGKQIIETLENRGEIFIRRIYGNWEKTLLHGWNECILNFSLRAVQQPDFVAGKNATDMSLTIDAMDVLHDGKAEIFALVSNDSDFTPLVIRLREGGMNIIGLGTAAASNAFRAACNEFIDLSATVKQSTPEVDDAPPVQKNSAAQEEISPVQLSLFAENNSAPEKTASSKVVSITRTTDAQNNDRLQTLHELLRKTASLHGDNDGFVPLCRAGDMINSLHLDFGVKDLGYGTLQKFVADFPDLYEIIHRDNGENFCYRCRTNEPEKNSADNLKIFHDALREATTIYADENGFANICSVGSFVTRKNLGFGVKDLGFGTLQKFVANFPDRYELRKIGNKALIRCRVKQAAPTDNRINQLHEILRKTAATYFDETGFTDLSYAGNFLGKQKIGFGIRSLGFSTLKKFVENFPDRYEICKTQKKIFYRCRDKQAAPTDDKLQTLHNILREAATVNHDDDGFSPLNYAGQQIKNKNLGFSVRDFGYGQLRDFVAAFPDLYETIHDADGSGFRYRCKLAQK